MNQLHIRKAGRADRALLAEFLRGLSPNSVYQRFQAYLGPEPKPALVDAMLPGGRHGGAVLGLVDQRPVAHGMWVRVGMARVAEIAVVVADTKQGQGIGTQIAVSLIADLASHGVQRVKVFTSANNNAVTRMVTRRAPDAVRERDGPTITYTFTALSTNRAERNTASTVAASAGDRARGWRRDSRTASATRRGGGRLDRRRR
ncbi:hypothetical protein BA895_21765 [Humibacillus sp. DSM 29435]|uniref:GNAT family N-acetyltransferase n=1 Tax=Humibacillus sp. DSM 29435 TaxID=1869167 RepID=UPI0008730829|nr:GNAT family N-acetyltransferase [Humibacillus sp. DSM 29435]OFE15669.1 hypothetical protein BA895_21765 [Humibacillus sp. DSM 29435]